MAFIVIFMLHSKRKCRKEEIKNFLHILDASLDASIYLVLCSQKRVAQMWMRSLNCGEL